MATRLQSTDLLLCALRFWLAVEECQPSNSHATPRESRSSRTRPVSRVAFRQKQLPIQDNPDPAKYQFRASHNKISGQQ